MAKSLGKLCRESQLHNREELFHESKAGLRLFFLFFLSLFVLYTLFPPVLNGLERFWEKKFPGLKKRFLYFRGQWWRVPSHSSNHVCAVTYSTCVSDLKLILGPHNTSEVKVPRAQVARLFSRAYYWTNFYYLVVRRLLLLLLFARTVCPTLQCGLFPALCRGHSRDFADTRFAFAHYSDTGALFSFSSCSAMLAWSNPPPNNLNSVPSSLRVTYHSLLFHVQYWKWVHQVTEFE